MKEPSSTRERNPRLNIGLSQGRLDLLKRFAKEKKSSPSTEATYLLSKILDELDDQGKIPPHEEPLEIAEHYETFAQLVMHNYSKLMDSGKFEVERLQALMSGEIPTETELLRVALISKVSEEYAIKLSHKKGNGHGSSTKRN
jgi:hypothetical protein